MGSRKRATVTLDMPSRLEVLDKAGVQSLANIPTKEVLLAQLLGLMQSPVSRMARVLAALAEKRSEGAAA